LAQVTSRQRSIVANSLKTMMRTSILIAVQVLGAVASLHGPGSIRPGFIALRASDGRPKASEGAGDCVLACGDGAPKNCVDDCNSAVYQCINNGGVANAKETQRCRKEILTGIKRVRTLSLNALPNTTQTNKTTILAADQKLVRNKCHGVCGQNVNSSCVTECEMEMYSCIDSTLPDEVAEGKREECFKKVLKKYEGFKKEWNATHGFVARHDINVSTAKEINVTATTKDINGTTTNATVYYKVTDADRKMIKDVCNAACTKAGGGAPSSMCVTHCETDMYRCIKETLPNEMDDRKKCRSDTQAKYEAWGSSL